MSRTISVFLSLVYSSIPGMFSGVLMPRMITSGEVPAVCSASSNVSFRMEFCSVLPAASTYWVLGSVMLQMRWVLPSHFTGIMSISQLLPLWIAFSSRIRAEPGMV